MAKAGRPFKNIDTKLILKLAKIGCINEEIATICGCSVDTLVNNYSDYIKRGRSDLSQSLRRMQYKAAQKGNVVMQIWLGKQLLKQRDKFDDDTGTAEKIITLPSFDLIKKEPIQDANKDSASPSLDTE